MDAVPNFSVWKKASFNIRFPNKNFLLEKLAENGVTVTPSAKSLVEKLAFPLIEEINCDLVVMDVKNLPSATRMSHYYFNEIFPLAREINLKTVSAAFALYFRLEWKDQPLYFHSITQVDPGKEVSNYGRLHVAMEPIPDFKGDASIFVLAKTAKRGLLLDTAYVGSKGLTYWLVGNKFLFRRID